MVAYTKPQHRRKEESDNTLQKTPRSQNHKELKKSLQFYGDSRFTCIVMGSHRAENARKTRRTLGTAARAAARSVDLAAHNRFRHLILHAP